MSADRPLPTLRQVLANVHFRVTLFAVGLAGITVLLTGMVAVRGYANHNLQLVAQSASYTVEAALVFGDAVAAAEGIAPLAANEDVAELAVYDTNGRLMAGWRRNGGGAGAMVERGMAAILFPAPISATIRHQGAAVGEVRLRGDARGLIRFIERGLAGMLACLLITAIASYFLARRLQQKVVHPLSVIASTAHSVRARRAFGLRAPRAEIAEIDSLGQDFNALLEELETWQAHIRSEHETLAHRATHDALTGLANRAFFETQVAHAAVEATANEGWFAILYLDFDRFKEINDTHGHAGGDAVLVEVAGRIKRRLRPGDAAARLGGDEFAILLVSCAGRSEAEGTAAGLAIAMADPVMLPGGAAVDAELSIGIAVFPENGRSVDALMRYADAAMYGEKQGGRPPTRPNPPIPIRPV
jgi:diguanylate cyclase (GGDEF)-like protein